MEDLTPEYVQLSISNTYDSVVLINTLKVKTDITEQELDIINKNKQHISIMLNKTWFAEGLTPGQKTELEDIIQ